jgi:hypothetical protein
MCSVAMITRSENKGDGTQSLRCEEDSRGESQKQIAKALRETSAKAKKLKRVADFVNLSHNIPEDNCPSEYTPVDKNKPEFRTADAECSSELAGSRKNKTAASPWAVLGGHRAEAEIPFTGFRQRSLCRESWQVHVTPPMIVVPGHAARQ